MDVSITQTTADKIKAGKSGLLLISDNYDAFAARVLAARDAARALDVMYCLWHDDHTGRLLLQEVVRAAQRGVRVRMLLDDVNPRKSDAAYLALSNHSNIELKLLNPSGIRARGIMRGAEVLLRLFALTRRMHNKAWIGQLGSHAPYFEGSEEKTESTLLSGIRGKASIAEFIAASSNVHWVERVRVISDPPEKFGGWRPRGWLMKELLPKTTSRRMRSISVSTSVR
ncbi:hypothetical protein GCM10007881_42530 [Mesorhizobium huakuii]|uniref:hypothetical protein n=1 Tax=Mesorhizobium huakuii TaxID=28104 RepID=UPI00235D9BEF|nr:hypothetical protein [Mesorhizobium huakuii]GLQ80734.1 hypothetical protein GCM10007881_42530 [Mesorhizobium huakuii]